MLNDSKVIKEHNNHIAIKGYGFSNTIYVEKGESRETALKLAEQINDFLTKVGQNG